MSSPNERNQADPTYVMGRSAEETAQLQKQSRLYDPSTRQLFEETGLTTGMKVLTSGVVALPTFVGAWARKP